MKRRLMTTIVPLILALGLVLPSLPSLVLAYGNAPAHGDWRVGGPHRTINALALDAYLKQAASDPILASYDFQIDALKVYGPAVGEPGLFDPGKEDKSEPFRWWVIEGGYSADEPELYASFRHFYNPRAAEMGVPAYLTDHLDQLVRYSELVALRLGGSGIVKNPEVDARDWAINGTAHEGWGENAYSWTEGIDYLDQAFDSEDAVEKSKLFAQAWRSLGETMHLLGDMTCPPHVRNDSHPAYAIDSPILQPALHKPDPNKGFLKGDPYETYATQKLIEETAKAGLSSEAREYINTAPDVLQLFDKVALFTNMSVFSGETVSGVDVKGQKVHSANGKPDFPRPRLDPSQYDKKTGMYFTKVGDRDVCLAHESWMSEIGWGEAPKRITYQCVRSQAELLIPAAVAANARLVGWFVPRMKLEITSVDTDNRVVRGTFTHQPYGAHKEALTFNTAAEAFNPLRLNGMAQSLTDYHFEIDDGVLEVTYGNRVAENIESLRLGGGRSRCRWRSTWGASRCAPTSSR